MHVITPIKITDSMLVTNIPEDDYPTWAAATTYARGDFCISTVSHTVYRSLTSGNQGNNPDAEQAALANPLIDNPSPVNWQVISATNRWKPFDGKPSLLASRANDITIELTPGTFYSGMAIFGADATEMRVTMTDPTEGVVFDRTIDLADGPQIVSWDDYFFNQLSFIKDITLLDLPLFANAEIRVRLVNSNGVARVGQIAVGRVWDVGETLVSGTSLAGLDFSYVKTDDFGDLTRVKREATQLHTFDVAIPSGRLFDFKKRMTDFRGGELAVWVGDQSPQLASSSFGFSRDWRVVYSSRDWAVVSIQIQGVV